MANLSLMCATRKRVPRRGWREVDISDRRSRLDWAACVKELAETDYPAAEKIVLAMDQHNIHTSASLYEAFPPAKAKRLANRLRSTTPPGTAAG